jgi:uncharacterized protein YndB with AHSA1/START domain
MNPEPDLSNRTLTLTRTFDAPPEKVYRAWTEPALYKQWNVPRPWVITEAEGVDFPDAGIYLEVIPGKRLVFTDAYTSPWLPSEKPFMTVSVDFEPLEGCAKTRENITVLHWSVADREAHERMGFHKGWGQCADQLAELLASL